MRELRTIMHKERGERDEVKELTAHMAFAAQEVATMVEAVMKKERNFISRGCSNTGGDA